MKYCDDPVQNAAFNRCVGFLAEMIEKHGSELSLPCGPPGKVIGWDKYIYRSDSANPENPLTDDIAA